MVSELNYDTCRQKYEHCCPEFLHVSQALSHQEKAVMSSERLQGIDHPQTILDYVSSFALFLIYRLIFGH